jgi:ribosomal-protein-alanine N-acetyltransferase
MPPTKRALRDSGKEDRTSLMRLVSRAEVSIRRPAIRDREAFLEAVHRSRVLHRGWVAPPRTLAAYRRHLQRFASDDHESFLVVHNASKELAGVINISHIVRASFRSAYLGYYAFSGFEGRGLMRQGMLLVLRHAFRELKLHRIEANIQPRNVASRRLLLKLGFAREGYSKRYLKISGRWRDHERWVLLVEDFRPQGAATRTRKVS